MTSKQKEDGRAGHHHLSSFCLKIALLLISLPCQLLSGSFPFLLLTVFALEPHDLFIPRMSGGLYPSNRPPPNDFIRLNPCRRYFQTQVVIQATLNRTDRFMCVCVGGGGQGIIVFCCFSLPKGRELILFFISMRPGGVKDCLVSIISFLDKLQNCLVKFSQVPCWYLY